MKNSTIRHLVHALVLIMGIILMIGGIITSKHGATVVGVIVSGVSVQQWLQWNKKNKAGENKG
jgi:uncharacterized membrane protein YczE